ncbi:MAG: ABC transporter substrate-binding protein [Eubacteriales bacterium]|nr:ABC transporter substrate-binding protein [Eubacteriales bacterium]
MERKSLRLLSMILALIMVLSFSACGQKAPAETEKNEVKTVINLDGTELTVPTNVEKIGAIFGPAYEKIVLLGAEDKIVFDGDFHINGWPWSNVIYKNLNDVPGILNAHSELNVEDLLQYEADVVFNFSNPETTAALEEAGISVVPMASTNKLSDIKDTVALYAEVIGGDAIEISDRYSEYFDGVVEKISAVTETIPEADRPKVYIANQNILWTSGKNSDLNELIKLAGGNPVAKDLEGGGKTEITKEQFIEWNPDYVFVDHAGSSGNATAEEVIDEMLADAEFSGVNAVSNDQVIVVPTGVFFWDSGVQKPLFALMIAKTLYPEQFADVDIKAELISFYSEFFHYDLTDDEADRILAHLDPA